MEKIILKNQAPDGTLLEAVFLPEKGMNMISFKKGDIEAIDQSTLPLFEERYAGLGALIGPHFHHRRTEVLPKIQDESLFPHIQKVKAKGIQEPFSHGIGRYAPWKAESTDHAVKAVLTGKDTWNGVSLADLEGQNFKMIYSADLQPDGLHIELSVVSDSDSVVGLHYYYYLPDGEGKVVSSVKDRFIAGGEIKNIPIDWEYDEQHQLIFPTNQFADYTFYPYPNPCKSEILLVTTSHSMKIAYESPSQENCWQLYHPENASFVCIEPISAQDPRHPNLTVSSLRVHLNIEQVNKTKKD